MKGWLWICTIGILVVILVAGGLMLNNSNKSGLPPLSLSEGEQWLLLQLARRQMEAVLAGEPEVTVDTDELSANLKRHAACFVTLTKDGALRGCIIDTFSPHEPLYQNAMRNIILAATADERFSPVALDELEAIQIEISVLDVPEEISFAGPEDLLAKLTPREDGVILTTFTGTSTYLPQVWEIFPDPAEFLSHLCEKQGAPTDCWQRHPPPRIEIYHVIHFAEGNVSP